MTDAIVDWPQIGDIARGHSGYRPDPSAELVGKSFHLKFATDLSAVKYEFVTGNQLRWYEIDKQDDAGVHTETCEAFRFHEDIFFVDFVLRKNPQTSITLILDLARKTVFQIRGILPTLAMSRMDELTRLEKGLGLSVVQAVYQAGVIEPADADEKAAKIERTQDLTGKRFRFVYSDTHVYDHIYINDKYYFWYCHDGPDKGLGDFEHCDYFRIAPAIYLICWRERLSPCIAVMLEDHINLRSLGKIFGLDVNTGEMQNFTAGAYMQFLNDTPYDKSVYQNYSTIK